MGMFFSAIHIQNRCKIEREQFVKVFSKFMKTKGLIPATEEDFQFSYRLAFSGESDWVTLSMPGHDLNSNWVQEDVQALASALKTYCISSHVYDSDVLSLELFGSTENQRDAINLCDGGDYGIPESGGKQELWEPLLVEGATWEQVQEIYNGSYTFKETALREIAPLLGIDADNATTIYEHWDGRDASNVINLYLKSADEKIVSLNVAFKKIFGEALAPLGFVKIKSKYPYFVRLVDNEIVHIIALKNEGSGRGWKKFSIHGAVATVYRPRISLDLSPRENCNWLRNICVLYEESNPLDFDRDFRNSLSSFSGREETMSDAVRHALEMTEEILLPIFDKCVDIDSCIDYFNTYGPSLTLRYYTEDSASKRGWEYYEGLLYLMTENYINHLTRKIERNDSIFAHHVRLGTHGYTQEALDERISTEEVLLRRTAERDKFINDLELYTKTLASLERRKAANIEILRSYGLKL